MSRIQTFVDQLLALDHIRQEDLVAALQQLEWSGDLISESDISKEHPYARHVLFANPRLEVMVASWRRGHPCAPHDHGNAVSAIKVLKGRSHHRGFCIQDNQLNMVFSERKSSGDILLCAPYQIHAMGDDAAEDRLMTLHMYAGSIENMIVYSDTHTHLVSGQAGAWLPVDEPEQELNVRTGHCERAEFNFVDK